MKKRLGFIGLGNMGQRMAARLLEAGFPLVIYDVSRDRIVELADRGAGAANSTKEVANRSDVIITMIPDGRVLRAVALGDNGSLAGAQPGNILIDMSTVDPESSSEVAKAADERGVKMLRAPVSGSTVLAAEGKLTIFASGEKQAYDQCLDIFGILGKKTFYVGANDESRYVKLALNMMVGTTCQMLAEALTFGEKAGIAWEILLEIIGNSVVASPLVCYKIPQISKRDFKAAFTTSMISKDLDLALDIGKKLDVPMPTTSLVRQFLGMLKARGQGDLDFSALLLLMEELGGIKHSRLT
jgi:3-hydroxyisobutyrate dehydrogenase-like beta-hydroxyacid dehydrogenase